MFAFTKRRLHVSNIFEIIAAAALCELGTISMYSPNAFLDKLLLDGSRGSFMVEQLTTADLESHYSEHLTPICGARQTVRDYQACAETDGPNAEDVSAGMALNGEDSAGPEMSDATLKAIKGAHPETNRRIIAQIQYVNSLFGRQLPTGDRKINLAAKSNNSQVEKHTDVVWEYTSRCGVRFMENYI